MKQQAPRRQTTATAAHSHSSTSDTGQAWTLGWASTDAFGTDCFKVLTVMDNSSRLIVSTRVSHSESISTLVECVSEAVLDFGLPTTIYVDNSPSFSSSSFKEWVQTHSVSLEVKPSGTVAKRIEIGPLARER
jgi:transposase InsO family protein